MLITLNNSDNVNATSNAMLTKTIQNNSISTNYSRLLSNQLTTINKMNHKSPIVLAQPSPRPVATNSGRNDNFKIKIINRNFTNDDDDDRNDGEMMEVEDEEDQDRNEQFKPTLKLMTTTSTRPQYQPQVVTAKPQQPQASSLNDANLQGYKLIVSNLHPNVTQEDLMVSMRMRLGCVLLW